MYDKDSDDFNMMDDVNFGDNKPEIPDNVQDISKEVEGVTLSEEQFFAQGESFDDIAPEAPYEELPEQKTGSKAPVFVVVFVLGIILSGALVFIYADNIPYLSTVVAKIKSSKSQPVKKTDARKIDINIEDLANNTQEKPVAKDNLNKDGNDELSKLLDETSEETGVTITRDKNKNKPDIVKPIQVDNVVEEDEFLPPLPGAEQVRRIPGQEEMDERFVGLEPTKKEDDATYRYSSANVGRQDPFNPTSKTSQFSDIVAPPANPDPDPEAAALLTLKISGIMYTPDSPSAIINIKGQDQLVRSGDSFNGFSVEKITKDKVTVRNKANTYTASVGEILNIESVGINSVPDLNNKFAGPYLPDKEKIIEINDLN